MRSIQIKRFSKNEFEDVEDKVARESMMKVEINDTITFEVVLSPNDIDEFIIGHLFTEGYIKDRSEVNSVKKESKGPLISAYVKVEKLDARALLMKRNYNVIWTECGASPNMKLIGDRFKIEKMDSLDPDVIVGIPRTADAVFDEFRDTGAYHYTVLFDLAGKMITYDYDIGRHNAFDKMIGKVINEDLAKFDKTIAFTTGRVSSDIVLKALRCGIPCLVSRSAPLEGAINLAEEHGMTLIGFLRGSRFNLYTNRSMAD